MSLVSDGLAHFFQQVAGEDEVGEALVGRAHDVGRDALPLFSTFIDEDDILADAHHGVHDMGVDDGVHLELLSDGVQQVVDN